MSSDNNTVSDQTVSSLELTLGAAGGAFSESSEQSMMEGLGEDWSSPSSSTSPTAGYQPLLGNAAIFPPPPSLPPRPDAARATVEESDQAATGQRPLPNNTADTAVLTGLPLPVGTPIVGSGATDVAGLIRQMIVFQHERQVQEEIGRKRREDKIRDEQRQRQEADRARQAQQERHHQEDQARQHKKI